LRWAERSPEFCVRVVCACRMCFDAAAYIAPLNSLLYFQPIVLPSLFAGSEGRQGLPHQDAPVAVSSTTLSPSACLCRWWSVPFSMHCQVCEPSALLLRLLNPTATPRSATTPQCQMPCPACLPSVFPCTEQPYNPRSAAMMRSATTPRCRMRSPACLPTCTLASWRHSGRPSKPPSASRCTR